MKASISPPLASLIAFSDFANFTKSVLALLLTPSITALTTTLLFICCLPTPTIIFSSSLSVRLLSFTNSSIAFFLKPVRPASSNTYLSLVDKRPPLAYVLFPKSKSAKSSDISNNLLECFLSISPIL